MQLNSPLTEEELHRLAAGIKILLMDVDGVLTDGRLYFIPNGDGKIGRDKRLRFAGWYRAALAELVRYQDRRDQRTRISGDRRTSEPGRNEMGIPRTHRKDSAVRAHLAESQADAGEIAYVGDDLTDVVIMKRVGLSFATANARCEVKRSASAVTEAPGGAGAVREVMELLLKARGVWDDLLKKYEVSV